MLLRPQTINFSTDISTINVFHFNKKLCFCESIQEATAKWLDRYHSCCKQGFKQELNQVSHTFHTTITLEETTGVLK